MQVGIHGMGVYLPEQIRKNDWWPESIVDTWRAERQAKNLVRAERDDADPLTEGAQTTFAGMAEWADDPFKGAVERRIMPPGMKSSDMEVAAAEEAMQRAGVDRSEIDLLMVFSQLPDQLIISNVTRLHDRLKLPKACFSLATDSACNAFPQQLMVAEQMIKGGRARKALIIQSSGVAHITRPEDPQSALFGDGATAAVVGPVSSERGVKGWSHRTDGSYHEALLAGCPGRDWWEGPAVLYVKDRPAARRMLMVISDLAKEAIDGALADAGLRHEDVNFYATHQSTRWFREVTQKYIGLPNAKSFDSFAWTAGLGPCNLPFMLAMGEREGLLREGDIVAAYTGGSGVIYSGVALRWGR